ncbi:MAG: PKD domain-containing protein [Bacteroidota bacterium]|nr:PKD domain-containing protein [Bacteroidota bacterium]
MKKAKYIQKLVGLAALILVMFACAPEMDEGVDIGAAPTADQLDFSITPGNTDFKFVLNNTSSVTGIASWDLGNGSKSTEASPTVNFPMPGEYTITMTLITKGGVASKSKKVVQTKTDYSIFTDPKFIFLSGGTNAAAGKTWVLDSLVTGHIGVGPAGTIGLEWWAAGPLAKAAVKVLYDDEINFKVNGFVATLTNHGKSYVKGFVSTSTGYSNGYVLDSDFVVDYTPSSGTWFIEDKGGKSYLTLGGPTPMFPCFDVGATNGSYEILKIEENALELVTIDRVEGNAWHYKLIPKGYVKPKVTFNVSVAPTANVNGYSVKLSDIVIPAGLAISNIKVEFGDGTVKETTDMNASLTNTYMRKAPYNVKVTVTTTNETVVTNKMLEVAANHPSYVPFLLDMMVTYADFSEVSLAPVSGQDCSVTIVDNPSKVYPNKSSKVAYYSKTNNEWANAYMQLAPGYRFDLRSQHIFKIMVYGKAGDKILMKLENTDRGGNAWQTGTADLIYTIQKDNTWEVAEYNFAGVGAGWDWTGDQFTSDVTTSPKFNQDFYNVIRIMCNPGVGSGTHQFYFDDLAGPHVEGLKSATIK